MKIWTDLEFLDDGRHIDIISLALVAEDGRELYLQSVEFEEEWANDWVKAHVLPHLTLCPCCRHKVNHENGKCRHADCPWRTRIQMRQDLLAFIGEEVPEFWGWCSAYDWVALCQLFGPMGRLPERWPHYLRDIQQVLDERGITDEQLPKPEGTQHHALADARHIRQIWQWLYPEEQVVSTV